MTAQDVIMILSLIAHAMAWRAWLHGWTVGWREGAHSRIEDVPSVPTDWVDLDRGD